MLREAATRGFGSKTVLSTDTAHVASRSSWFVPIIGLGLVLFAMVNSAIEGANVVFLANYIIGLSLVCYRLWPSSARRRIGMLWLMFLIACLCLTAQLFTFLVDSSLVALWAGDKSIIGLVLDGSSMVLLLLLCTDTLPDNFRNPSTVRFWRVPAASQFVYFLMMLTLACIFNPSIFLLPVFLTVLYTLAQFGDKKPISATLVGRKDFSMWILWYCNIYGFVGYCLCLPVIGDAIKSIPWLPMTLGIPMVGEGGSADSLNYSCILPASIALFLVVLVAPWWCDVNSLVKSSQPNLARARTRRMNVIRRASGSASVIGGLASPRTPRISVPSIEGTPKRFSTPTSDRRDSSNIGVYSESQDVRKNGEKNERILLYVKLALKTILFPLLLVVVALLFPSTLSIGVVLIGILTLVYPRVTDHIGPYVQEFLTFFCLSVFIAGVVWELLIGSSAVRILAAIGVMDESEFVWNRFLLLFSLSGLVVFSAVLNRFCQTVQLDFADIALKERELDTVNESAEEGESVPVTTRVGILLKQALVGMICSAEMMLTLVLSILFTTAAITQQTNLILIVYLVLSLPVLWFNKGNSRYTISILLAITAALFVSALLGWVAWSQQTITPQWMLDCGFTDPKLGNCFLTCLPHVLIVITASLYVRFGQEDLSELESKMSKFGRKHSLLVSRLGITIPMVLSLALFVMMPFDYFSAVVILCFVVQMGLLLEATSTDIYTVILRIFILQIFLLIGTLVWVFVSMIPWINSELIAALSTSEYIAPSELAVEPNAMYLGKLTVVSVLLLSCSIVLRNRRFIGSVHEENAVLVTNESIANVILVVNAQCPRILMYIVFLASIYQTTLLNAISEYIVCFFLVVGRGWSQVGAVFSVFSMLLLFLQYFASFQLIQSMVDPNVLDYIGMYWSSGSVARNICIFLACILQRNLQHFVVITFGKERAVTKYSDGLEKYGQLFIGLIFVFAACGRATFYSLIYIVMAVGFAIRQSVTESIVRPWTLRLLGMIVWVCLAAQVITRLWFPSVCEWCRSRPSMDSLCPSNGDLQISCIDDWQRFFNAPSSVDGNTALIDYPAVSASIATSLGYSSFTVDPIKAYGLLWDFTSLWVICVILNNSLLGEDERRLTASRVMSFETQQTSLSHVGKPTTSKSLRRLVMAYALKQFCRLWIVFVQLLAVLSSFTFRETVDLFSLSFIILTFWIIWAQQFSLVERRKAIVGTISISFFVVLLSLFYQVPSLPCKFWNAQCTASPVSEIETYTVPTVMCIDLQKRLLGCENYGTFTWTQIAIQLIGLMKADPSVSATPFPMTIGPPVLLLAACLVQLAMYDFSETYKKVDAVYFEREIGLRVVRARRMISEFNAGLLIRTRKVKCALDATKRKLLRVQEAADALLNIFYSRLTDIQGLYRGEKGGSQEVPKLERSNSGYIGDDLSEYRFCSEYESLCARGYATEEAEIVVELTEGEPEGTGVLILNSATDFGLGSVQESEVILKCKSLLQVEVNTDPGLGDGEGESFFQPSPSGSVVSRSIADSASRLEKSRGKMSMSTIAEARPKTVRAEQPSRWSRIRPRVVDMLARHIEDVAFVQDHSAAEPLSLHRVKDSVPLLLGKVLFSNSLFFVVFFAVMSFVSENSIFALVRILILLGALPAWPYPSRWVWKTVLIYTICGLLAKAVYQLPIFCGVGVAGETGFAAPLWRFTQGGIWGGFVTACPTATTIGWDVWAGMPKGLGSSAPQMLSTSTLFNLIWPELFLLGALFAYRALMYRSGLWEHVVVATIGQDAGAILVPRQSRDELTELSFDDPCAEDADENPLEDSDLVESGEFGEEDDELEDELERDPETPIGSFVDLDCKPLSVDDREVLSQYAVSRHMSNEDVYGRISLPLSSRVQQIQALLQIYKHLRWDAQIHYANQQAVRIPRESRELKNMTVLRGLESLPTLSSWFVKINPFYAVKVGVDYYSYLCLLGIMMFFHVIVFYPSMTGAASANFLDSLKRSQFSAGLALLMFFHFVLIVFDRAYYMASFRRGRETTRESKMRVHRFVPPSKHQVYWFCLRVFLLVGFTVALHAVIMNILFSVVSGSPTISKSQAYFPLINNAALTVYYLEFILYLLVSVLQIKEGFPRVMKESMRPEMTYNELTDRLHYFRFLLMRAIPFLDELRIIIDWTVSRTSLQLDQFFKLEDAHTYLWITKCVLEERKSFWPAESRPMWEKGLQGLGFLLVLMIVIIGPVLLFSTLVDSGTVAPVSNAELSVTISTISCPSCTNGYLLGSPTISSEVSIYSALPTTMQQLSYEEATTYFPNGRLDIDKASTVQTVSFGQFSDWSGLASVDRINQVRSSLAGSAMVNIQAVLKFNRESADGKLVTAQTTVRMPACSCKTGFGDLCSACEGEADDAYFAALSAAAETLLTENNTQVAVLPAVLTSVINVDSSGAVVPSSSFGNATLAVSGSPESGNVLVQWSDTCGLQVGQPGAVCASLVENDLETGGSPVTLAFVMTPVSGASGSLLSIGIVTVYITIVFAIGRFLRVIFDKESLRVIYLEIPRPDDFLDLANGAVIARHFKDLPMEFRLYNCLIKVLRSPETLVALGGADLTGYGVGRTDDPPFPDLLDANDTQQLMRRRRGKAGNARMQ